MFSFQPSEKYSSSQYMEKYKMFLTLVASVNHVQELVWKFLQHRSRGWSTMAIEPLKMLCVSPLKISPSTASTASAPRDFFADVLRRMEHGRVWVSFTLVPACYQNSWVGTVGMWWLWWLWCTFFGTWSNNGPSSLNLPISIYYYPWFLGWSGHDHLFNSFEDMGPATLEIVLKQVRYFGIVPYPAISCICSFFASRCGVSDDHRAPTDHMAISIRF